MKSLDRWLWFYNQRQKNRFWWFTNNSHLPSCYRDLPEEQWNILMQRFDASEKNKMAGECNVPVITQLLSFIAGSGMSRVVQLGTYAGYGSLLMGWELQQMVKLKALFSVDNNPACVNFAKIWNTKAGLNKVGTIYLGDSANPDTAQDAIDYFDDHPPQLVFIDSAHSYHHTLMELDLWYQVLAPGGFIMLHDVSDFATQYDRTGAGGVQRAVEEWRLAKVVMGLPVGDPNLPEVAMLNKYAPIPMKKDTPFKAGCGLGIIQKV